MLKIAVNMLQLHDSHCGLAVFQKFQMCACYETKDLDIKIFKGYLPRG